MSGPVVVKALFRYHSSDVLLLGEKDLFVVVVPVDVVAEELCWLTKAFDAELGTEHVGNSVDSGRSGAGNNHIVNVED